MQRAAIATLGNIGLEYSEVHLELEKLLESEAASVRIAAAARLYPLKPKLALCCLVYELGNTHHYAEVVTFLQEMNAMDQALALLQEWLERPDPQFKSVAATRLGVLGPQAARTIPLLVDAFQNESDDGLRCSLVRSLGRINPSNPQADDTLHTALQDWVAEVRAEAAAALCLTVPPDPQGLEGLHRAFSDLSLDRTELLDILIYLVMTLEAQEERSSSIIAPILARQVRARNPEVRAWAVRVVAKLGERRLPTDGILPALVWASLDSSTEVRCNTAFALLKVLPHSRDAVTALAALLNDPSDRVRLEATYTARDLGFHGLALLPTLLDVSKKETDTYLESEEQIAYRSIKGSSDIPQKSSYAGEGPNYEPIKPELLARLDRFAREEPHGMKTLRVFYEVGKVGSFAAAATSLVTNKSVTKRGVDDLDRYLDMGKLVTPLGGNRGIELSALGDVVWLYCHRLFGPLDLMHAQKPVR